MAGETSKALPLIHGMPGQVTQITLIYTDGKANLPRKHGDTEKMAVIARNRNVIAVIGKAKPPLIKNQHLAAGNWPENPQTLPVIHGMPGQVTQMALIYGGSESRT